MRALPVIATLLCTACSVGLTCGEGTILDGQECVAADAHDAPVRGGDAPPTAPATEQEPAADDPVAGPAPIAEPEPEPEPEAEPEPAAPTDKAAPVLDPGTADGMDDTAWSEGDPVDPAPPDSFGNVIIVEVADDPIDPAVKFVELYNADPGAVSLEGWTLLRYANGIWLPASIPLHGVVPPGGTHVIAYELEAFTTRFGTPPSQADVRITGNGDDAYALLDTWGLLDSFGEPGADGSGTVWDYADGLARRRPWVTAPQPWHVPAEWELLPGSASHPFDRH